MYAWSLPSIWSQARKRVYSETVERDTVSKEKQIEVVAASTQDSLERGADVTDTYCQTVAEAKRRAKYFLTEEYRMSSESSSRLGYSQVLVNGSCVADFFAVNA